MKRRDGLRLQLDLPACAIAHLDIERVRQEIERHLEYAHVMRYRARGQSARVDIERDVPAVIEPWRRREPDLADDLRPEMQGRAGLFPFGIWQCRPGRIPDWLVHGAPRAAHVEWAEYA